MFQGLPSVRFDYSVEGSALEFYEKLRKKNPSPYMHFVKIGERQIIGSSPELICQVQGDRVQTFPIAGTRSRGKDEWEDKKLEDELLHDSKERAEHMMLVDM